ncbi:MAG: SRPBCC domain-containing protein [Paracoccaceae bacterium]
MTDHAEITHDRFRIERLYPRCMAHVWSAWTDPARKWTWFGGGGPMPQDYALDFRTGGHELARFVSPMGQHENRTTYLDIAEAAHIVFAYSMALDGRVHSASVATVEFDDHGGGTRLVFTESIACIGPSDGMAGRKHGWDALLASLDRLLAAETPA